MLGLWKKFFGKSSAAESSDAPHEVPVGARPGISQQHAEPSSVGNSNIPSGAADGPVLQVGLASVLKSVPADLLNRKAAENAGSATVKVRANEVIEQLKFGAVRLPFGRIRREAPPGVFINSSGHDNQPIELPLGQLLPQISAETFTLRADRVRVEVPEAVGNLFGSHGELVTPLDAPRSNGQPIPSGPPHVNLRVNGHGGRPEGISIPGPAKTISAPVASPAPARSPLPAPSVPQGLARETPGVIRGVPSEAKPRMPEPVTAVAAAPAPIPMSKGIPFSSPAKPSAPSSPASVPAPASAVLALPKEEAAASKSGVLTLPVMLINQSWPEALKSACQSGAGPYFLDMPLGPIEQALRQGRAVFTWEDLNSWMRPPLPSGLQLCDAQTRFEIPLSVVAPSFFGQCPRGSRPTAGPAAEVPDVFKKSGGRIGEALVATSAPVAPMAPAAPAVPGTASAEAAPVPASTAANPAAPDTTAAIPAAPKNLAELFGEPNKRDWTPNEIVQRTCQLPGVNGAMLVLHDGLLVAACVPPSVRKETLAAFLPQIFGRMRQYSEELALGPLRNLSMSLENETLIIFEAGLVYFAALGPADGLPLPWLQLIARELNRHTS